MSVRLMGPPLSPRKDVKQCTDSTAALPPVAAFLPAAAVTGQLFVQNVAPWQEKIALSWRQGHGCPFPHMVAHCVALITKNGRPIHSVVGLQHGSTLWCIHNMVRPQRCTSITYPLREASRQCTSKEVATTSANTQLVRAQDLTLKLPRLLDADVTWCMKRSATP